MKMLLVMRHAKSSWEIPDLSDHDRPLNERGLKAARQMGDFLKAQEILPELIICSSARRTQETAEILINHSGFNGPLLTEPLLYGTSAEQYLKIIQMTDHLYHRVMVIGHNPSCESLCNLLSGEKPTFATATIGCLELPIEHWTDLKKTTPGILKNLWSPKTLFS